MDFLRSTSLRVSLIAAALLLSTSIASADPMINAGQFFVIYTQDDEGSPGALLDGGFPDLTLTYSTTLHFDGLTGGWPTMVGATSAPSAGEILPGFNQSNQFFTLGWVNANTGPGDTPEDHLIIGGPDFMLIGGPGDAIQTSIIAGLKALGTDPMLLGTGVMEQTAGDYWAGMAAAGMFAPSLVAGSILNPFSGAINALIPDGVMTTFDNEVAGFSHIDFVGLFTGDFGRAGRLNETTLTDATGQSTTFIPEPGTGALLLVAAAGLAVVARRRRRAA